VKEENRVTIVLAEAIMFDYQLINKISFDLVHINQGWDEEKHDYAFRNRSDYNEDDIVEIFEQLKYFQVEWTLGVNKEKVRIKGVAYYRYHWMTTDEDGDSIRVVFDVPLKYVGEGVIVTVFTI
jgi:hypothetical protein